jgi:predicted transcriptional regulator
MSTTHAAGLLGVSPSTISMGIKKFKNLMEQNRKISNIMESNLEN